MAKNRHPIEHFEWRSRDAARLQHFYGGLFGWTFSDGGPGYTLIAGIGGIAQVKDGEPMQPGLSGYVSVDDLAPIEEKIVATGGKVLVPKQSIGEMGFISIFADPDGNVMGLWAPAPKPKKGESKKAAHKAEKAAHKAAKKAAEKAARKAEKEAKKAAKQAKGSAATAPGDAKEKKKDKKKDKKK